MISNIHSINFGDLNSFEDFHLFPKSRPFVVPPEPQTDFVEVTGMDGVLDYTNVLVDKPLYKDREGSWDFKFIYFGNYTWHDLYYDLYTKLNGKYFNKVTLEDDTDHFYRGRIEVESWSETDSGVEIKLKYHFDPKRYANGDDPEKEDIKLINTTQFNDWKWNDILKTEKIKYGRFTVVTNKRRVLINELNQKVKVSAYCTTPFVATKLNGESYELRFGQNSDAFSIDPGNTVIDFYGNGDVQLSYPIE